MRGFINQSGGSVEAESNAIGAKISILLPEMETDLNSKEDQVSATEIHAENTIQNSKSHIMVVDDNVQILETMVELLKGRDLQVSGFSEPDKAINFVMQESNLQCAMLDQRMPKMSEIELARIILNQRPDLPVILCSGNLEDEETIDAKKLGIEWILRKPIKSEELHQIIIKATQPS